MGKEEQRTRTVPSESVISFTNLKVLVFYPQAFYPRPIQLPQKTHDPGLLPSTRGAIDQKVREVTSLNLQCSNEVESQCVNEIDAFDTQAYTTTSSKT